MIDEPFSNDPFQDDAPGVGVAVPEKETADRRDEKRQPRYHVILWDSDEHSYEYVMRMMRELFGHKPEQCFKIAQTVDEQGRAVVLTTTKEHAELKRDQIHAYGKDEIIAGCKGAMWATIEPEE